MREGRRCISVARWADHDDGHDGDNDHDDDEGSA